MRVSRLDIFGFKSFMDRTVYEEVSLLSLSSTDYCQILPLLRALNAEFGHRKLALALPSSRVDALRPEILDCMQAAQGRAFTIAPEAGTQRLRDVINKRVTEDDLLATCENVFKRGCTSLKLYFMIGLPTEREEDVRGIAELAGRVRRLAPGRCTVTASVSTHVPKPHTPFQWAAQSSAAEIVEKQKLLGYELKIRRVNFRYHDAWTSLIEGVLARGDRRLGTAVRSAYELSIGGGNGDRGRGMEAWQQALRDTGIEPAELLRAREREACFPWDHIASGLSRSFLWREWERALRADITDDCLAGACTACGVCADGVANVLYQAEAAHAAPEEPSAAPAMDDNRLFRHRFCYSKLGPACFISHLELINIFVRALRAVEAPLLFTAGFTPRPRISFGPPLQLGVESECEYFDLLLRGECAGEEMTQRLNVLLPEGVRIVSRALIEKTAPSIQEDIAWQNFTAVLRPEVNDRPQKYSAARQASGGWQERSALRTRKKGSCSIPLNKVVRRFEIQDELFRLSLAHHPSEAVLKPSEALQALTELEPHLFQIRKVCTVFAESAAG